MMQDVLMIILAYAIGCLSTGYYLTRLLTHTDVRTIASRATGATNVSRVLGRKGFILTFIGDLLRGLLVILLCRALLASPPLLNLAFIAVVAGHIWPAQLGFQGGKGVAVMTGALFAWDYRIVTVAILIFGVLLLSSRHYRISVVTGILAMPAVALLLGKAPGEILTLFLVIFLITLAHRDHWQRFSETTR